MGVLGQRNLCSSSEKNLKDIFWFIKEKQWKFKKRKNKKDSKFFFKTLRYSFIHLIFNKDLCFAAMV